MKSRLPQASAIAVAATMITALFSASDSGAFAQALTPELVESPPVADQAIETSSNAPLVAVPVIQNPADVRGADGEPSLSTADAPESGDDDAGSKADAPISARSLAELVSAQPAASQLSREMQCLAGAIYFEARGESLTGQLAVGRVVIARSRSGRFPSSYCGVVYQRSQFSFVRGNRMPAIQTASRGWREAVAIARIADSGSWRSPTEGALFFHAAHVRPGWRLARLARIDNHIFYR